MTLYKCSAQQQTQSTNQQVSPIKVQCINVPLHKQNAENHSMTRRSAPIIARRLSLPYSRLPPLIPKPNLLNRSIPTQVNNQIVANKIQHSGALNGMTLKRPIPTLNEVYAFVSPGVTKAKCNGPFAPKQFLNATVLRKSMPPTLTANKSQPSTATTVDNDSAKLISVSKLTLPPAHITRLPPTLKPAPRQQVVKTHTPIAKIPMITRVQSINSAPKVIETISTPVVNELPNNVAAISTPQIVEVVRRDPDVM